MIYNAIGIMSGSSLDGLDIAYVQFLESGGKWSYEIIHTECYPYTEEWQSRLKNADSLSAIDYQLLHSQYGHFIGEEVNSFINKYDLHHKVHLVASHGHTAFHLPQQKMTAQLGDGSAIAAVTKLPVISDLRNMDMALGGQGAPIVPIGERLLFNQYHYFLNIGGIANISFNDNNKYVAFDVCPANRVMNMLANHTNMSHDEEGKLAAKGTVHEVLLQQLNSLEYYIRSYPKSLPNSFGAVELYGLIKQSGISVEDALRTYVEHIVVQVKAALFNGRLPANGSELLVTGGGALNLFLMERLKTELADVGIAVVVPDQKLIEYKEALIMALIGVLRWREEVNVYSSVTGAAHNSIGGALWLGGEG